MNQTRRGIRKWNSGRDFIRARERFRPCDGEGKRREPGRVTRVDSARGGMGDVVDSGWARRGELAELREGYGEERNWGDGLIPSELNSGNRQGDGGDWARSRATRGDPSESRLEGDERP